MALQKLCENGDQFLESLSEKEYKKIFEMALECPPLVVEFLNKYGKADLLEAVFVSLLDDPIPMFTLIRSGPLGNNEFLVGILINCLKKEGYSPELLNKLEKLTFNMHQQEDINILIDFFGNKTDETLEGRICLSLLNYISSFINDDESS